MPEREPRPKQLLQTERFENFNEYYRAVDQKLRPVLAKYFPEYVADFEPPPVSKIRSDFEGHIKYARPWIMEDERPAGAEQIRIALRTVAIVRFIDDFIDSQVWSKLNFADPADQKRYQEMLDEIVKVGQLLEPSLTEESIRIFRIEANLAAQPTQENFDERFSELFRAKSYDIALCYCQVYQIDIRTIPLQLTWMGIADCLRDFETPLKGETKSSTDFDFYHFIVDHRLNPTRLITYIEGALQRLSDDVFAQYKAGQTADRMLSKRKFGSGIMLIVRSLEELKRYRQSLSQ